MADTNTLIEGLVTHLKADTGLVALVSSRIYPQILPAERVLPAITYQMVTNRPSHFSGTVYRNPYLLFKAWSYTHGMSWQVAEALRASLDQYHGSLGTVHSYCLVGDMRDGAFEPLPAPGIYPVFVFVSIDFKET